ncbi:CBD9-like protein [Aspergillus homomorphus CBS 101889]|uniref:CBD9-like protein n=1 Tax=Aspergillus homomorphus (strain CBS 101889) TaxID=1450537 RepID=A0A395IBN6_ASPHC|nr:CBD9-like protein [Aspergillus homomorphus CBS 101889]RAL17451.1 CBD9-like protein [Aspergillus homomorphus CBS 101889]
MSTANIFILWAASTTEVTLSPRSGGSGEPTYNPRANVTLLPGSGVANGTMTANIRCENCLSTWPSSESGDTAVAGFEMDPNGNATEWFWACQSGEMLGTDDPSADLGMHDDKGVIMFDLSRARFPVEEGVCLEGVNPFV